MTDKTIFPEGFDENFEDETPRGPIQETPIDRGFFKKLCLEKYQINTHTRLMSALRGEKYSTYLSGETVKSYRREYGETEEGMVDLLLDIIYERGPRDIANKCAGALRSYLEAKGYHLVFKKEPGKIEKSLLKTGKL